MNLDKNQTIEEIMSFKQPKSAYVQLYSATTKSGRQLCDKLGIFPSLIFALVVVVLVSWGLSSLETALNLPNVDNNNLKKIEQGASNKLHWGTVARKVLGVEVAHAVDLDIPEVVVKDDAYAARYVSQSVPDPVEIEAGTTKTVVFKFKNIGSATWNASASRFISAFTMEPRYRTSEFRGSNWIDNKQTAKMIGIIKPGEIGELIINLKAPDEVGEYIEKFYLAAENYSWIKGGYFFIKIKVVPKIVIAPKQVVEVEPVVSKSSSSGLEANTNYKAYQLILSKKNVSEVGGEKIKIIVGYQNKGSVAWQNIKLLSKSNELVDDSWVDGQTILSGEEEILPSGFWRKTFYFRTPKVKGEYNFDLELDVDDGKLVDKISIPVSVTDNAPTGYKVPTFNTVADNEVLTNIRITAEPRVRVGIAAPETNFIQFRSYEDDYNVFAGSIKKGVLPMKKFAVLKYEDGVYNFKGGELDFNSPDFIRLEPVTNPHAVFHLPNLISRSVTWVDPNSLFNKYRGALEYRIGEVDKKMYIVNDLLIEDYVRGMTEVGKNDPLEFVKANLVAARNYVYYNRGKYSFFDVLGNTFDQLYLGYEAEAVLPVVQEATEATRGVFVTYGGEVVTTPYFGNSNGQTKSFSSVWGGSAKPWLVPVVANYDTGRKMLGHGVGMSQRDAGLRAKNEGLNFVELLKYYYSGVEVEKLFN